MAVCLYWLVFYQFECAEEMKLERLFLPLHLGHVLSPVF